MPQATALAHVANTANPTSSLTARFGEFCPPASSPMEHKLGWLAASLQSGQAFLRAQSAFPFIELAVKLILGKMEETLPKKMSRARINHLKREVREIIATQTNLNPQWSYDTDKTDQVALEITKIFNQRIKSWWSGRAFPIKVIKEVLQYSATASGYLYMSWEQGLYGSDEEDVNCRALGPMDVIPDGVPKNWDLQKAAAVHICLTEPTIRAKMLWPLQAGWITSDRFPQVQEGKAVGGSNWMSRLFKSPLFSALYGKPSSHTTESVNAPYPETDIYHTYIIDDSYNATGDFMDSDQICQTDDDHRPLNTSYYYEIPPWTDDGQYTRKECGLYPTRRLIIWTRSRILYDGPSHYWHGRVPVTKFSMDEWIFEYLGSNVIEENRETQASLTSLIRYFIDTLILKLDPPTKWHEKEFGKEDVRKFKLRSPGERIRYSGVYPDPVSAVLPYQHYEPSQQTLPGMNFLIDRMNHMLGVQEFQNLQKLGQIPSAEGIDKILGSMSSILTDYALSTERSLTEAGYQFMWLVMQFDTAPRRLKTMGPMGLVSSDFDWNPGVMIPDTIPGESDFVNSSDFHRALAWGRRFRFGITPLSSFSITDSQQKLMLFQLFREPNFPMDPLTVAERWGLPNFGKIEGDTILERWANWQTMKAPFLANLQAEAGIIIAEGQAKGQIAAQSVIQQAQAQQQQQQMAQLPPQVQQLLQVAQQSGDPELMQYAQQVAQQYLQGGGAGLGQQLGQGDQGQQNGGMQIPPATGPQQGVEAIPAANREGRPPSGGKPPSLQTKDGMTRSTIAES